MVLVGRLTEAAAMVKKTCGKRCRIQGPLGAYSKSENLWHAWAMWSHNED